MDAYQTRLSAYRDVSVGKQLATGDDYTSTPFTLIAARTGETIYVQRLMLSIETPDRTKSVTFQDTSGTPILLAKKNATADLDETSDTPGPVAYDFGGVGYALVEGKGLTLKNSATGIVMSIQVQAYQRLTATTPGNAVITANIFGQQ